MDFIVSLLVNQVPVSNIEKIVVFHNTREKRQTTVNTITVEKWMTGN